MTTETPYTSLIWPPTGGIHWLTAFFTTKEQGIGPEAVTRITGVPAGRVFMPIQEHTDKVHVLGDDLEPVVADAVVTRSKNTVIGVRTADCVPLLLYDVSKRAIASVHAGWKGTAKGITIKTVNIFVREFGSSFNDIKIMIGPSIRGCCYEVGKEVRSELMRTKGVTIPDDALLNPRCVDLPRLNIMQALSLGVPERNIWDAKECTRCQPEKFFSYRYSGRSAGRQGGFILIR